MGSLLLEFFNRINFLRIFKWYLFCGVIWSLIGFTLYRQEDSIRLPHIMLFTIGIVSLVRLRNTRLLENEEEAVKLSVLFLLTGLIAAFILIQHNF